MLKLIQENGLIIGKHPSLNLLTTADKLSTGIGVTLKGTNDRNYSIILCSQRLLETGIEKRARGVSSRSGEMAL